METDTRTPPLKKNKFRGEATINLFEVAAIIKAHKQENKQVTNGVLASNSRNFQLEPELLRLTLTSDGAIRYKQKPETIIR